MHKKKQKPNKSAPVGAFFFVFIPLSIYSRTCEAGCVNFAAPVFFVSRRLFNRLRISDQHAEDEQMLVILCPAVPLA